MPRTHLLLVDLPRLLAEIVIQALSSGEHVEFVGTVEGRDAVDVAARGDADFIVIGHDDHVLVSKLLSARPATKVLAIIGDGRDAALYELRPHRVPLGELSPERLVAVVADSPRAATKGATWQ